MTQSILLQVYIITVLRGRKCRSPKSKRCISNTYRTKYVDKGRTPFWLTVRRGDVEEDAI